MTNPKTSGGNVKFYRDKHGEWRWKVVARNNRIIADSGEGYKNKADCEAGYQLTQAAPDAGQ